MAKKNLYTGKLTKEDNWGGPIVRDEIVYDAAAGSSVQDYIKETLDSKVSYLYRDELNSEYKLFADEASYNKWVETEDDSLILGRIQIESNYRLEVGLAEGTLLNNAVLLGEKNCYVGITMNTYDKHDNPIVETTTITYIITRPNGDRTVITHYGQTAEGKNEDEVLVDDYITEGQNTISITVVGNDTGAVGPKTVYYQVVNLAIKDDIDISKPHDISGGRTDSLRILWSVTGSSEVSKYIQWYVDGVEQDAPSPIGDGQATGEREATISITQDFTEGRHNIQFRAWLGSGGKIFYTPTYYRDFIVYKGETEEPIIAVALKLPVDVEPFGPEQCFEPIAYDVVQYNNFELPIAVYKEGVLSTNVTAQVTQFQGGLEIPDVTYNYSIPNNEVLTANITPNVYGESTIKLIAGTTVYRIASDIEKIGFNIQEDNTGVILNLRANGKSNEAEDRDVWEYHDTINNITYHTTFNGFTWDEKSGWNDNSLVIANNNSIDIDIKPLTSSIAANGLTFELEYSTINVANDDEVLLNMRDAGTASPGLTITASEAIFRDNAGNVVSTKFKSGENNRVAFVVSPNAASKSFLYIYVNGALCGAANYDIATSSFAADKNIHIAGTSQAEIKLKHIRIYNRPLIADVLVNNYILYRDTYDEMRALYNFNNVYANDVSVNGTLSLTNIEENIPVLLITDFDKYSEGGTNNVETLQHFGSADKGTYVLIRQIEFVNNADPTTSFLIDYPQMRCQGTSSMAYPRKNFRFYTKDKAKRDDWADPETHEKYVPIVYKKNPETGEWEAAAKPGKGKISFKSGKAGTSTEGERPAQEVTAWCLKADYAESSSSHNTGVARLWNQVMRDAQVEKTYVTRTIAQDTAMKPDSGYKYDVRTCVDGFPIVIFSRDSIDSTTWNYIGKYNFNNDKSTESVFGFCDIPGIEYQEYEYEQIDQETYEAADPTKVSASTVNYVSVEELDKAVRKKLELDDEDIPTEMDYINALCPTVYQYSKEYQKLMITINNVEHLVLYAHKLFTAGNTNVRNYCVEYLENENSLTNYTVDGNDPEKGFFAPIKDDKGKTVENWTLAFEFRYPEVDADLPDADTKGGITNLKDFYDWVYSTRHVESEYNPEKDNTIVIASETKKDGDYKYHQAETDVYANNGTYTASNFEESAYYKKLKFEKEKWDHLDVFKMAAYYVYFMRFGGVDQVVKNSMMNTEGTVAYAYDGTKYELVAGNHCKWFFINYDNDTILGLNNDGNLAYPPTIDRNTRVGEGESAGYAYAGHNSTLWNNLENDEEFMQIVSAVDNGLYEAGLTYEKAVEIFNEKQADKWCKRLLNKDSNFKYIDTYISGEGEHLGKLQGPRTSHRTWWLNKRFTLYDSKFLSGEYKNKYISFKAIIPESPTFKDVYFTVTPTELMNYGWGIVGRSNGETGVPSTKDEHGDFNKLTFKPYNGGMTGMAIGDETHIYATPYISEIDLSTIGSNLVMVDFTGVYNEVLGSQLKRIILGGDGVINDGEGDDGDFVNNKNFKAINYADKLEYLNIEGFKKLTSIDLSNNSMFKELHAFRSGLNTVKFGNGSRIELLELPESFNTLLLDHTSYITKDNIKFENNNLSNLTSITFKNCDMLKETSFNFFREWFTQRNGNFANTEVTMEGIDWKIYYSDLDIIEQYKSVENAKLTLTGKVTILDNVQGRDRDETIQRVTRIKSNKLFGPNCFDTTKNPPVVVDCVVPFVIINSDETVMPAKAGAEVRFTCDVYPYREPESTIAYTIVDEEGYETRSGAVVTTLTDGTGVLTCDEIKVNKDVNITIRCTYMRKGSSYRFTSDMNILITDPIYPNKLVLTGSSSLYSGTTYNYKVSAFNESTPATGTYTLNWEISPLGSEFIDWENTGVNPEDPSQFTITTTSSEPAISSNFTLSVSATTLEGLTVYKMLSILSLNHDVLMTVEGNPVAINQFRNAGIIDTYANAMLRSEAANVTDEQFGVIFRNVNQEFSLNELEAFTSLTQLAPGAFSGSSITSITIPENIVALGEGVFDECAKLVNVSLPSTISEIPQSCFRSCAALSSIVLPEGVTRICDFAFGGTNITQVVLASSANKENALVLPATTLTTIDSNAFDTTVYNWNTSFGGNNKITRFEIPASVTSLGDEKTMLRGQRIREFYVEDGSLTFASQDGILFDRQFTVLYKYPCYKLDLTSYSTMPSTFELANFSFFGCKLEEFIFGQNVSTLGVHLFQTSYSLETVDMSANNNITTLPNFMFAKCSSLKNVIFGSAVEKIGYRDSARSENGYVFSECNALTELVIPDTVTSMWWNSIAGCANLLDVVFPKHLTFTQSVLIKCPSLTGVTLPSFSETVGGERKVYNSSYSNYNFVDRGDFYDTTSFVEFRMSDTDDLTICKTKDGVLYTADGHEVVRVPFGKTNLVLDENITSIKSYAFEGNIGTGKYIIPDTILTIGSNAFQQTSYEEIVVSSSVNKLEGNTFYSSSNLKKVVLKSDSMISFGILTFGRCPIEQVIILAKNVPSIVANTFQNAGSDSKREILVSYDMVDSYLANPIWAELTTRADRPFEIKECAYSQTIYVKIYVDGELYNSTSVFPVILGSPAQQLILEGEHTDCYKFVIGDENSHPMIHNKPSSVEINGETVGEIIFDYNTDTYVMGAPVLGAKKAYVASPKQTSTITLSRGEYEDLLKRITMLEEKLKDNTNN